MMTTMNTATCDYIFEVGQLHVLFINQDGDWMGDSGCPEPMKKDTRKLIRKLDKLTGRKPLVWPPELR
jgi:hypothetical protein